MGEGETDDREVLLRDAIVLGHAWAWTELYDTSYDALWGYVYWRTGRTPEWTEEVVQQTWLVAIRKIRGFDARRGRFVGWLRGIADKVLKSELRRWLRDEKAKQAMARPSETTAQAEETALRREEALGIAQALAAIPLDYESVLRAKYLDGRRVTDIADDEGVSAKTIESRLTRRRKAFAEAYASFVDSEARFPAK